MITNIYKKEIPGKDDIINAQVEFHYYPEEPKEFFSPGFPAEVEILRILDEEGNEIESFSMKYIENLESEIYNWTEDQRR